MKYSINFIRVPALGCKNPPVATLATKQVKTHL